jgi:hypothetical protein
MYFGHQKKISKRSKRVLKPVFERVLDIKFTIFMMSKTTFKCVLDYNNYEYKIYLENTTGGLTRVGTTSSPIKWYEYVNP